jgi:RNA polymerase sigma factor (sigma-70 family)
MAGSAAHPVLRFLRTITASAGAADTPDAQLLARFVAGRDETAFAALVRRHGPMVLGVCVRILGNTADAEDAFQATFLVLVRRARSVGRPDRLANWLYGVAHRTALKARADAARRRRHESRVEKRVQVEGPEDGVGRDLRPVLDEELNRLPMKYRVPLVLCHLEGHTHEEIARRLGCPRETVTTRLTRGRERLRRRMVRRGVTLSTGALAAALSEGAVAAGVPAALLEGTVKAAVLSAAGRAAAGGAISARVAALTEGVVRAMWMTKLKLTAAVLVGVGVLAWGAGMLAHRARATEPAPEPKVVVVTPAPEEDGDDEKASVQSMPPVVVKTVPQSGDTQVDAATTTEIRVTFSKDMADKSWSWSQISKETFPQTTGKPHYENDKRTCVLPVKLEPGKTYVIWLNPPRFRGFIDTEKRPADFYRLVFQTKR